MPEEKNPIEQVLDLVVFAPLGLVMTARTQLPEMVAKGRSQVEGQLSMARFLGQFAVQQGKVEVEKRIKAYTDPPSRPEPDPPVTAAEPAVTVAVPLTVRADPAPSDGGAPVPEPPAPSADELAIHGYDALSASQVVQRLAGLSKPELEQVRLYEASTRGRKTVLTKISQLQ